MNMKGTDTTVRQMQQLWQSVLATERAIKPDDNFFELGGTWSAAALLSIKAASQGFSFVAEDIYEHPRFYDIIRICGTGAKLVAKAAFKSDEDPASSFPAGSTTTGEAIWQTCDLQPKLLCNPTGCLRAPTTLVRAALALMLGKYEDSVKVALGIASPEVPMSPIIYAWDPDEKTGAFLDRIQQLSKTASRSSPTDLKIRCGVQVITVLDASQYDDACREMRRGTPSMALDIYCMLSEDRVSLISGSYSSILSVSSLLRILDQVENVVQQLAVCQSDDTLRNLQYLSPRDRQQLLEWNRILPLEVTACIHEQFESVVRRQPDATAVDAWDGTFSYRELETYSYQLAAYLAAKGITREVVVGICYQKSKWAVVCMLATLKAGGVCLFLDPEAPRLRRESMLHDAKVKLLLTSTISLEDFRGVILCLEISDTFLDTLEPSPASLSAVFSKPSDAAFISFSSGNTGIPKASVTEHRSVCTLAKHRGQLTSHGPGMRLFQYTSHTFDVAFCDMVTILLNGGCLCIPSDEDRMNNLAQAISLSDANLMYLTPSVLEMLTPESLPRLSNLIVGGEALTTSIVHTWADKTNLMVTYGPSECTVSCMGISQLGPKTPSGIIGKAMGSRTWVVDTANQRQLAAIGTVDELWIEGPLLGRGYIDATKNINAFFHVSPFLAELDSSNQVRLYRAVCR